MEAEYHSLTSRSERDMYSSVQSHSQTGGMVYGNEMGQLEHESSYFDTVQGRPESLTKFHELTNNFCTELLQIEPLCVTWEGRK